MPRMWGLSSQAHVTRNDLSHTPPSVNKVIVMLQPPRKGDEARPLLWLSGREQAAFPSSLKPFQLLFMHAQVWRAQILSHGEKYNKAHFGSE